MLGHLYKCGVQKKHLQGKERSNLKERMGFRFRKSFKIAPGVKFNLNKKSHSFTFGGKGMHYTVNSNGKRTKSFGIPGSGLYCTETKNGKTKEKKGETMRKTTNQSGGGCLGVIVLLIMLSVTLAAYSLFWIPAIPVLVYFLVSKKFCAYRVRNTAICSVVLITSLIVFIWLRSPSELNSISVEWGKEEFNIGDVTEVKITPSPSDAEIETLELSENNIATLKFEDGKAIVTFANSGDAVLFFTANNDVKSISKTITVINPEEARLKAEEEEQIRLEQEAQAAEQARIEQEQAAAEQERIVQEQAAAQAAQEQAAQQSQEDPIVYVTNTGAKYHRAGCRTLKSQIEKHLSEVRGYYEPCGICNPPQ